MKKVLRAFGLASSSSSSSHTHQPTGEAENGPVVAQTSNHEKESKSSASKSSSKDSNAVSATQPPQPPVSRPPTVTVAGVPMPPHLAQTQSQSQSKTHKSSSKEQSLMKKLRPVSNSGSGSGAEDSGHDSDVGSEHDSVNRPPHRKELDPTQSTEDMLFSPSQGQPAVRGKSLSLSLFLSLSMH
jgi:hypothetical protein